MLFPGLEFALKNQCDCTAALDAVGDRVIKVYFRNHLSFQATGPTLEEALLRAERSYLAGIADHPLWWPERMLKQHGGAAAADRWLAEDANLQRSVRWFKDDQRQIACLLSERQTLISFMFGRSMAEATQAAFR